MRRAVPDYHKIGAFETLMDRQILQYLDVPKIDLLPVICLF